MRTALKEETSLTGNVQTLTLACPSISPAQAFSTVEGELKASGFQSLFSNREHVESAWITGRSEKKWVELVSVPDGAAVSYALTVVPSAEVLTKVKSAPEPNMQVAAEPIPAPAPVVPPVPVPAPIQPPQVVTGFIPPSPILQVPLDPSHDLRSSVIGDVVINMLVDINEKGAVTKADLTGQITKEVLKLESAALDAVWRWRFEPARQDGRAVAAVKIPVQMSFRGRPSRY
jgi:outer membrane biosynthesis protein TonB